MTFYGGVFLIRMEQEKQYEAPGYMTYREAALMFSLMPESDAAKAISNGQLLSLRTDAEWA